MPKILAASHSLPPHRIEQTQVKEAIGRLFAGHVPDLEGLLHVFDNSRIETRHLVKPLSWYLQPQSPSERNAVYLSDGMKLLVEAAQKCLDAGRRQPEQVDHVICVSTTGLATPSLDARLIGALGLPPTTSRLPVWGLGCCGGASGLSRAFDYCRAHPKATVLLTALECCSLTLQHGDTSKKNLVGTALFSDGAAAVLVAGNEVEGAGPRILATGSHLFADTDRIMGWDFVDGGMELVLSPRLPALIKDELAALVDRFLKGCRTTRKELAHYLVHPGGAKVIDAYRQALQLSGNELELTEKTLRRHGNISSVSVLMVLEEWLDSKWRPGGGLGLLSAFGPGFSAEMLLLEG